MKNHFITLTLSSVLGTLIIFGVTQLESHLNRLNNPEYAEMMNELEEFAISEVGFLGMFFFVIYPYQFAVLTLQRLLAQRKFSVIQSALTILAVSTTLYSIGFMIVFRSPHLGVSETIPTFAFGILIFGIYFVTNLSTHHFLSNISVKRGAHELDNNA
jgi:hypothetical protein